MSSESPSLKKTRGRVPSEVREAALSPLARRLLDWTCIGAFLALTSLLGMFPLKDTDFWWHLRTGDLIRQGLPIPTEDLYTFTVPKAPWTDLHWLFQVALSWGYAHGGVVALNLAKCVITCTAVFLLITARRREWPVWVMVLAWLPALFVLGGRMYVRPETVSLLFLSAALAILFRIDRRPSLAFALPVIQVAWVNTQGLFVLGPIVLLFALIDAALRPGAFAKDRNGWWRKIGIATGLTGLACLVNPYGIAGALYPIELARTMGNPIFSTTIAELTPIPTFIERAGWGNLPLQLHVATMILGALSFLIPMFWTVGTRLVAPGPENPPNPVRTSRKGPSVAPRKTKSSAAARRDGPEPGWRLSPFRLLLFGTFSALSWQATRNSHQFAAVVGTVTAWNFGEWAGAIRGRRAARNPSSRRFEVMPRLIALGVIALAFLGVASGQFYRMTGEGRTIGLGEEPLWYPHEAISFAGKPGMPERFLGFHIGHASLYEYAYGPERKVFADARLEVMGPELYERYIELQRRITGDTGGWEQELDTIGNPLILVDNAEGTADIGVTLLANPRWRCVWFDPVATMYVQDSVVNTDRAPAVDFGDRLFRPDSTTEPPGIPALMASARSLRYYSRGLMRRGRVELARPMVLLGLAYSRRILQADPDSAEGWKSLGLLEISREGGSIARYHLPFDPVFDLSTVRATYALRRALGSSPDDFVTLLYQDLNFESRGMLEAALPLLDRLVELGTINPEQVKAKVEAEARRGQIRSALGAPPPASWENLSELDRIVTSLLTRGRAASAVELLERAYPVESRPWALTDRIGTLWLHLGRPERARSAWERAVSPPHPAVRSARVAVTHLVEGSFEAGRRAYHDALAADPDLFEASYGLAVLEQDAGRAAEALASARTAEDRAPSDVARSAARAIVSLVGRYTRLNSGRRG